MLPTDGARRDPPPQRRSQHSRTKGGLHPSLKRRRQCTPKTRALRQGMSSPPPQTHVASPPGGLLDLPAKRLKESMSQGREGFDNHQTHHQDNHQHLDPTTIDAHRDGEPKERPCPRSGRPPTPVRPHHHCKATPARPTPTNIDTDTSRS
jgi:hypothetical protein